MIVTISIDNDCIEAIYDNISKEPFVYDNIPYLLEDLGFVLECEVNGNAKKNA